MNNPDGTALDENLDEHGNITDFYTTQNGVPLTRTAHMIIDIVASEAGMEPDTIKCRPRWNTLILRAFYDHPGPSNMERCTNGAIAKITQRAFNLIKYTV